MIKKATNYIMSFLLLLSVLGVSINKHYSGSELYSVSVFSDPDSCCDDDCDCCNETSDLYQITDMFLPSVLLVELGNKIVELNIWFDETGSNVLTKGNPQIPYLFYKYLKYYRQNKPAQLQCFRL